MKHKVFIHKILHFGFAKKRACKKKVILCFCFFNCLFLYSEISTADLRDPIWGLSPCAPGGDSVRVLQDAPDICSPINTVWNNFQFLYGSGQKIGSAHGLGFAASQHGVYVPFTGMYSMAAHFCATESRYERCTIKNSYLTVPSLSKVSLISNIELYKQNGTFGGGSSAVLTATSSMCWTFVDERGIEWSANSPAYCADANKLPTVPANCYINYQGDLNVDMGSLERSNIATVPASSTAGSIKKIFPVLCTRDAGTTVKTTFQFTALTVNGKEVVSTSTPNLGVAIFYNGKLVGPASTPIIETFEPGYTDRELEFQAVRNADVEAKNITTGDFTASAVMVMTEQ